jgi:hypothetical protein
MTADQPEISENDQKLAHTLFDHLIYEVYNGLLTAYEESSLMKGEDERYAKLFDQLQTILDELDEIINSALDTIPGLPSREESEEIAREALDKLALMNALPKGSLTPEKEKLH